MQKKFIFLVLTSCCCGIISGNNIPGKGNNTDLFHAIFTENDLDDWEPPKELKKAFPYYLSGYDEECRPIWIGQLGKWDLSRVVSKGDGSLRAMQKLIHQGFYRLAGSIKEVPDVCGPVSQIVVIYDAEGFNYNQVIEPKVISYFLNVFRVYVPLFNQYMESIYFVNTNFMFKGLIEIARPLVGSLMERIEVYGPNKSQWLPKLLRKLPRDQLPKSLGGNSDFKPLRSYGL